MYTLRKGNNPTLTATDANNSYLLGIIISDNAVHGAFTGGKFLTFQTGTNIIAVSFHKNDRNTGRGKCIIIAVGVSADAEL